MSAAHNRLPLSGADQELKAAFRALARAFGGQDAVALAVGRAQGRVSEYASAAHSNFAPVNIIAHLEACTVGLPGAPHVTRLLARRSGFALVPLADADGGEAAALVQLADVVGALGPVGTALHQAAADGRMTAAEARAALAALAKLEDEAAQLRACLLMCGCESVGGGE